MFPGQEYRKQQYITHAKILALRTQSSGVEADHKQNGSNKYTLYQMDRRVAGQSFQEMLFRTMFLWREHLELDLLEPPTAVLGDGACWAGGMHASVCKQVIYILVLDFFHFIVLYHSLPTFINTCSSAGVSGKIHRKKCCIALYLSIARIQIKASKELEEAQTISAAVLFLHVNMHIL